MSGLTLVNDRAERLPDELLVTAEIAGAGPRTVASLAPQGVAARWDNGAIRITPSRTLTVRFAPVTTRRIRLVENGQPGRWSVAELFFLSPAPTGAAPDVIAAAVEEGRRLEEAGQIGPALLRYHGVMRQSPDDPRGYDAFARLTTRLRASVRSPLALAARFAELGLLSEARGLYADVTGALGPERVHVELWRLRARLAAADGDLAEAARLSAEADAAGAPGRPVGVTLGGQAELVGYDDHAAAAPGRRARRAHDALATPPGALGAPDGLGAPAGGRTARKGRAPASATTTRWPASCPSSARRST